MAAVELPLQGINKRSKTTDKPMGKKKANKSLWNQIWKILLLSSPVVSHCPPTFYLPCIFSKCQINVSRRIFPLTSILADRDDDSLLSLLAQLRGASVRDPAVLGVIRNIETVFPSASEQLQPKYMSPISPCRQLQKMDQASSWILNTHH